MNQFTTIRDAINWLSDGSTLAQMEPCGCTKTLNVLTGTMKVSRSMIFSPTKRSAQSLKT